MGLSKQLPRNRKRKRKWRGPVDLRDFIVDSDSDYEMLERGDDEWLLDGSGSDNDSEFDSEPVLKKEEEKGDVAEVLDLPPRWRPAETVPSRLRARPKVDYSIPKAMEPDCDELPPAICELQYTQPTTLQRPPPPKRGKQNHEIFQIRPRGSRRATRHRSTNLGHTLEDDDEEVKVSTQPLAFKIPMSGVTPRCTPFELPAWILDSAKRDHDEVGEGSSHDIPHPTDEHERPCGKIHRDGTAVGGAEVSGAYKISRDGKIYERDEGVSEAGIGILLANGRGVWERGCCVM